MKETNKKQQKDGDDEDGDSQEQQRSSVDISAPVSFWIAIVAIAAIIQLMIVPLTQGGFQNQFLSLANALATQVLYIPGIFIIPMIVALWIGAKVSYASGGYTNIIYRSMLNALYACVLYVIEIFMAFILSGSFHTGVLSSLSVPVFLGYVVAMPVLITIVVVPLFALVSEARRY